jgi:hypothetical protein
MTATAQPTKHDYVEGIHFGATYYPLPGSLSVSSAKVLLKAPALYKWQRDNPVHSESFDFGKVVHALVLGAGIDDVYVVPFDDWKTKAAQAERKIARADDMAPVTIPEWERACAMADAIAGHEGAQRLLSGGAPEVYLLAKDPDTGIMRRAWVDYLSPDAVVDYKTAASVEPYAFAKSAAKYGYHQQAAWTLDMLTDLGYNPPETFTFITQEKDAPYLVEVYDLDEASIERGRELNREALRTFQHCLATDTWPGYTGRDLSTLCLPAWAFYTDDEIEI